MTIDMGGYEPWYWLNADSRDFLSSGGSYLRNGQRAEDRIDQILAKGEAHVGREGWADEGRAYVAAGFVSFSSPVWSNFAAGRGLPISCYGSTMGDSMESIFEKVSEIGIMSKHGGGTSLYGGRIRTRGAPISTGGFANGASHYALLADQQRAQWLPRNPDLVDDEDFYDWMDAARDTQATVTTTSQSNIRRGNCAFYLDIESADVEEYLELREEGSEIQHLSLGLSIGDEWLASMEAGDKDKQRVWMRVLRKRFETGYPYLFFRDNANGPTKPKWYADMPITHSNLCTEIMEPDSPEESFVCCLSSLNLLHWHRMKHTRVIEWMCELLDAVMEEFIDKTLNMWGMQAAHRFASRHRAIGLGTLGYHSFLQSERLSYRSMEARALNIEIWKTIDERSRQVALDMGKSHGIPMVVANGDGRDRWSVRLAIAPTTSSSHILGQASQAHEPLDSNYFTRDLQKGKFTQRNPLLQQVLKERGKDDEATWRSVLMQGGSVQHLDFLSDDERDCLKTFGEIEQAEIVIQAAHRQKYIDQGQSVNLKIHPDTPLKDVNKLTLDAHKLGLKALYYQRSTNPAQAYVRELMTCAACEA